MYLSASHTATGREIEHSTNDPLEDCHLYHSGDGIYPPQSGIFQKYWHSWGWIALLTLLMIYVDNRGVKPGLCLTTRLQMLSSDFDGQYPNIAVMLAVQTGHIQW